MCQALGIPQGSETTKLLALGAPIPVGREYIRKIRYVVNKGKVIKKSNTEAKKAGGD